MYLAEEEEIEEIAKKYNPDVILIFDNNAQANYSFIEKIELTNAEIIHSFTTPYSNSNVYFLKLTGKSAKIQVLDYNHGDLVKTITVKHGDIITLDCQALARASD